MFLITANSYYEFLINSVIGKKYENRLIQIDYSNEKELLNLIENNNDIETYYKQYQNVRGSIINNETLINTNILYLPNSELSIISGNHLKDKNDILITPYIAEKISDSVIQIEIDGINFSYNVVGIVNANYQRVYISQEAFIEIEEKTGNEATYYNVLAKEFIKVNKLIRIFNGHGFNSSIADTTGQDELVAVKKMQETYLIGTICFLSIVILMLINIIKNIYYNEEKNIAILKGTGFKIKVIQAILFIRVMVLIIMSFIILILLSSLICKIFMFSQDIKAFLKDYNYILLCFKILLLLVFISYITNISYGKKIKNMNIFDVINK